MNKPNYCCFRSTFFAGLMIVLLFISCTSDVPVVEFIETPVQETTAPAISRVPDSAAEDNPVFSSPAPTATTKPPPTPTPTSVDTVIPGVTLDPVATAARIFPLSWSPDSKMLAYWTFTDEEVALDFTLPPGTLYFFNISTGESCQSSIDVGYGYFSPALVWLPDGRIQVLAEQGAMEGTPLKLLMGVKITPSQIHLYRLVATTGLIQLKLNHPDLERHSQMRRLVNFSPLLIGKQ